MGAPRLESRVQSRACGRNGPGWAGWVVPSCPSPTILVRPDQTGLDWIGLQAPRWSHWSASVPGLPGWSTPGALVLAQKRKCRWLAGHAQLGESSEIPLPLSGQRGSIIAGWLGIGRAGPLQIGKVSKATVCGGGRENVQGSKYRQGAPPDRTRTHHHPGLGLDSGVDLDDDPSTTRLSALRPMNVTLAFTYC